MEAAVDAALVEAGLAEKDVAVFLQGLDYTEEFSLGSRVSRLSIIQLPAVECYRLAALRYNRSQLIMAGIRVDLKRFGEVWVCQHHFSSDDALCYDYITMFSTPKIVRLYKQVSLFF